MFTFFLFCGFSFGCVVCCWFSAGVLWHAVRMNKVRNVSEDRFLMLFYCVMIV